MPFFLLLLVGAGVLIARSRSASPGAPGSAAGSAPATGTRVTTTGAVPPSVFGLPTLSACTTGPYFGGVDDDLTGLPVAYRTSFEQALAITSNPMVLTAIAANLDCFGYHKAANKFRAKSASLTPSPFAPPPPVTAPSAADECIAILSRLPNTPPAFAGTATTLPLRDWAAGVYNTGTVAARGFVADVLDAESAGYSDASTKKIFTDAAACMRKMPILFPVEA